MTNVLVSFTAKVAGQCVGKSLIPYVFKAFPKVEMSSYTLQ